MIGITSTRSAAGRSFSHRMVFGQRSRINYSLKPGRLWGAFRKRVLTKSLTNTAHRLNLLRKPRPRKGNTATGLTKSRKGSGVFPRASSLNCGRK